MEIERGLCEVRVQFVVVLFFFVCVEITPVNSIVYLQTDELRKKKKSNNNVD